MPELKVVHVSKKGSSIFEGFRLNPYQSRNFIIARVALYQSEIHDITQTECHLSDCWNHSYICGVSVPTSFTWDGYVRHL